jgi:hypothetical protein
VFPSQRVLGKFRDKFQTLNILNFTAISAASGLNMKVLLCCCYIVVVALFVCLFCFLVCLLLVMLIRLVCSSVVE